MKKDDKVIKLFDEEGNEEDLDKIYEIISEMVAKGFKF